MMQPNPTPRSTQQKSNSLAQRKKRKQKKKQKKKAQAQTLRITSQESDDMQKVKHSDVLISVDEEISKHVVSHFKALWG